jgi:hypothetical protein
MGAGKNKEILSIFLALWMESIERSKFETEKAFR